jgi:F-type H+-transporting ATPase subunit b
MLIDWFTIGAQVLNFLILVWLMKRFLYAPILRAIDAREKRVATTLADAVAKEEEAMRERSMFEKKNIEFDQQRADRLKKVGENVESERRRLLAEARDAAVALNEERKEALRREERNLQESIVRRIQQEVFDIARKTLNDLAGIELEERIVEVFLHRLMALDETQRAILADNLGSPNGFIQVRTAFQLSDEQHSAIQTAIDAIMSAATSISFETDPALACGVELSANGHKVAWSVSDYVMSLGDYTDASLANEKESRSHPGTQQI